MLLNRSAAALLGECRQFLAPYLAAAKLTVEVRRSLDVDAAAEWFARMLFSLFMTPSARLDPNDAAAVTAFVREHVVRGFVGPGPARRRATP
ncbi:MAG: TetR family transcriptional regulator [Mycobacterium sp.]|nr:TetR family transcriptional regulator [Mycobacterium sp.]